MVRKRNEDQEIWNVDVQGLEKIEEAFADAYRSVKGSTRVIQPEDHLFDDLGIDSLDAVVILVQMETLLEADLVESIGDQLGYPATVRELTDNVFRLVNIRSLD